MLLHHFGTLIGTPHFASVAGISRRLARKEVERERDLPSTSMVEPAPDEGGVLELHQATIARPLAKFFGLRISILLERNPRVSAPSRAELVTLSAAPKTLLVRVQGTSEFSQGSYKQTDPFQIWIATRTAYNLALPLVP